MSLFVLDTVGDGKLLEKEDDLETQALIDNRKLEKSPVNKDETDEDDDEDSDGSGEPDYGGIPPPTKDISHILNKHRNSETDKKSNFRLNNFKSKNFFDFEKLKKESKQKWKPVKENLESVKTIDLKDEISKSALNTIERTSESLQILGTHKAKKLKKIENSKSKGKNWFNMPATEVTDEIETDLKILQMRSVLNPKHFYKKNDLKVLPKYFQIGTVMHSPLEFYNEQHTRRNKKKTIVDELLADESVTKYTKRKYQEIMDKNQKYKHKKAMKKMKKLKKKK